MMQLVQKYYKIVLLWGSLLMFVFLAVAFFLPRQYKATSQVLIISRDRSGIDPYTQAKSAERIGENLAHVMQTSDFYNKVMASSLSFNKARWEKLSLREQRKEWQKDVQPAVVYNTSLLKITAFSNSKEDVVAFLNAINDTLTMRGFEYIGGDVSLKQVDEPLVSRLPARPNFVMTGVAGFVLGCLLSLILIIRRKRTFFA